MPNPIKSLGYIKSCRPIKNDTSTKTRSNSLTEKQLGLTQLINLFERKGVMLFIKTAKELLVQSLQCSSS